MEKYIESLRLHIRLFYLHQVSSTARINKQVCILEPDADQKNIEKPSRIKSFAKWCERCLLALNTHDLPITSHYRFNSARGEEAGWGQTKLAKANNPTVQPWHLESKRTFAMPSKALFKWGCTRVGSFKGIPSCTFLAITSAWAMALRSQPSTPQLHNPSQHFPDPYAININQLQYPDKTSLVSAKMDSRSASFKKKNRGKYNLQLDAILQCSIQTNNERYHWNPRSWSLAKNLTVFQHALLHLEMSCQDLPNSLPLGLEVVFESLLNFLDGHVGLSASEIHEFPYSPNTGTYYTWHWRNVEEQIKHLIYHISYMIYVYVYVDIYIYILTYIYIEKSYIYICIYMYMYVIIYTHNCICVSVQLNYVMISMWHSRLWWASVISSTMFSIFEMAMQFLCSVVAPVENLSSLCPFNIVRPDRTVHQRFLLESTCAMRMRKLLSMRAKDSDSWECMDSKCLEKKPKMIKML